jgi:DNA-binding response OmpR family regulator
MLAPVIRVGGLEIAPLRRRVRVEGRDLHLTPLELSLICLLAANAGRTVTRDEMLNHVWGADYVAESNVVDCHVRNLRAKLGDDWRRPRYIATVPGEGYRFVVQGADRGRPSPSPSPSGASSSPRWSGPRRGELPA